MLKIQMCVRIEIPILHSTEVSLVYLNIDFIYLVM